MAPKNALPPLSPKQVVQLQDELLANADRLLRSALAVLEDGGIGLARSLAILGMEESGKAIAIHQRRTEMAHEPQGAPFVNDWLQGLWSNHRSKLELVHDFLVDEDYWFDTEPPDPEENRAWLGEIEQWAHKHNLLKQRGFYVDVDLREGILVPDADPDPESLRRVIGHVHQIGWQLRLGEHIVAKQQRLGAQAVPPASDSEIERMREILCDADGIDELQLEQIIDNMRQGRGPQPLNNDGYRLHLPGSESNPFADLGKRGYEAQTRELQRLAEQIGLNGEPPEDAPSEQA
ncbi:AbiV family abortive infection protein [Mycobacteroides abscessus]|uniref:AbiV family abortive infection protein n=1 Tax=Mycobacteroides abscessus TaxID=36809 RepID=UPI000925F89E|nr:AbiV family abortive infection protein [Mycobacteroides abscessus]SHS90320.1 Uncharacterised protein [Mycobacteroides abscessus subsp. abscessus]SHU28340.1 Uncharacterised protein [Mycobacteroides abscessus subsp. abscessus]SHV34301.1 Uncharacterised protein [Mycobacteroides abscessus subsp. abscessus]SHV73127.1 Uncharacterised protein [Mycobacteroides abscessus subsp. abscessus]SHX94965.1 Uncharacterised protein [Mycobacteroides abscessus subsp. abscessus]